MSDQGLGESFNFNERTIFYKRDGFRISTESMHGALEEYERGDVLVGEGHYVWTPLRDQHREEEYDFSYDLDKGIAYCADHAYTLADLGRTFASNVRRAFFEESLDPTVLQDDPILDRAEEICNHVGANDLMIQALRLMGDSYEGGHKGQKKFTYFAWEHAYENDYWSDLAAERSDYSSTNGTEVSYA